jgi:hypothetical protein
MSAFDPQDAIALGLVALVAGLALWRRARRKRAAAAGACSNCDAPARPRKEVPLRFYRRRPGGDDPAR